MAKNKKTADKRKRIYSDMYPMMSPGADDIIIPIIGFSGSGKSTFINELFDAEITSTSSGTFDLNRCTTHVEAFVLNHPIDTDKRLVIVDTISADPDALYTDNAVAFQRISEWLEVSYPPEVKFAGVVYLHNITEGRVSQASRNMFDMVDRLCRKKSKTAPILATTRWEEVSEEIGNERLSELKREYWKEMIKGGSAVCRFEKSHESAWKIINRILKKFELTTSVLLDLKEQMDNKEEYFMLVCVLEQFLKLQKDKNMSEDDLRAALKKLEESYPSISKSVWNMISRLRSWMFRETNNIQEEEGDEVNHGENASVLTLVTNMREVYPTSIASIAATTGSSDTIVAEEESTEVQCGGLTVTELTSGHSSDGNEIQDDSTAVTSLRSEDHVLGSSRFGSVDGPSAKKREKILQLKERCILHRKIMPISGITIHGDWMGGKY
ncbi:hypothetical protein BDQ17DRAFT_977693 [Cyathus striatus]|nr:hypothetical protein BDQ17DRAFT_977693 [Cyathus striatus]